MSQTLVTIEPLLKERWLGAAEVAFNSSTILLDRLTKNGAGGFRDVGGEYYVQPIRSSRNTGTGSRAEGQYLPGPGKQGYAQAKFRRAHHYTHCRLSGAAIDAAGSNQDVVLDIVNGELKGTLRDHKEQIDRQLAGDGSGLLATCKSGSGTSITVRTQLDAPGEPGAIYLNEGMRVTIALKATGVVTNGSADTTINAITEVGGAVALTLSTAVLGAVGTTYGIYLQGVVDATVAEASRVSSSRNNEMYGLMAAISNVNPAAGTGESGRYGDIDRAAAGKAFWHSYVASNSGILRPLSLELMGNIHNTALKRGGTPNLVLSDYEMWQTYGMLISPDRRWQGGVKMLDGGFESLEFRGMPWVPWRFCRPNTIFLIDTSDLAILREQAMEFMDQDGKIWKAVGSGETRIDAYEAALRSRMQLACRNCFPQVRVDDVAAAA